MYSQGKILIGLHPVINAFAAPSRVQKAAQGWIPPGLSPVPPGPRWAQPQDSWAVRYGVGLHGYAADPPLIWIKVAPLVRDRCPAPLQGHTVAAIHKQRSSKSGWERQCPQTAPKTAPRSTPRSFVPREGMGSGAATSPGDAPGRQQPSGPCSVTPGGGSPMSLGQDGAIGGRQSRGWVRVWEHSRGQGGSGRGSPAPAVHWAGGVKAKEGQ